MWRLLGCLCFLIAAHVPLVGQWIAAEGPEWMLTVSELTGQPTLDFGTVLWLFLLFCACVFAGIGCFHFGEAK